MRYLICLVALLLLGCKEAPPVDVDGRYIKHIERNKITFEDGQILKLNAKKGSKTIYLIRHAEKDTLPEKNR